MKVTQLQGVFDIPNPYRYNILLILIFWTIVDISAYRYIEHPYAQAQLVLLHTAGVFARAVVDGGAGDRI